MPDRRQKDRADLIAFANSGELARFAFESSALKGQCDLVEKIVQQRQLVGDDRRNSVIPRECDRPNGRASRPDRMKLPFGRYGAIHAAAA